MKRCTTTHEAAGFGTIPAGSLWADDSEYITEANAEHFADVDAEPPKAKPKKPKAVSDAFKNLAEGND